MNTTVNTSLSWTPQPAAQTSLDGHRVAASTKLHTGGVKKTTSIKGNAQASRQQKAYDVARQFETFFVRLMVENFRKAQLSEDGGMFGKSVGSNTYQHWFDQHMSEHLAKNSTIGIADTLIRDFRRLGELPKQEQEPARRITHVA